jgi:uncharacterized membrane protein
MTTHLSRLYDTKAEAEQVLIELKNAGIPDSDISLIANNGDEDDMTGNETGNVTTGASLGAAVGGGAGLLTGLGVMAIPGVGPIVAAGWVATTLTGLVAGALTGAAAGGIVSALTDTGIDEHDAHVYAESVRRGGSIILVKTEDEHRMLAENVLNRHSSVSVSDRRSTYEQEGWDKFDEKRHPSSTAHDTASRNYPSGMI